MAGIIGRKLGMTQIFSDAGAAVPVTVIEAGPCPVTQIRTAETNGYSALQLGFDALKAKHTTKAARPRAEGGPRLRAAYAQRVPRRVGRRLRGRPAAHGGAVRRGDKIKVTGTTKGRGFQGVVKRHGFAGRPASHGHPKKRNPGTLGPGTNPSRVIKGKKMPGQMGNAQQTVRNLRVERVDTERNLIYIRGAVPGSRNSLVFIRKM
jgi:large subunit ribosomal protein L3